MVWRQIIWQCCYHQRLSSALASPETPLQTAWNERTYPRDHKLSSQILHFSFDFAADVELVAVQGDTLQVGQQVLFAGRVRALGETDKCQPMWTTGLWLSRYLPAGTRTFVTAIQSSAGNIYEILHRRMKVTLEVFKWQERDLMSLSVLDWLIRSEGRSANRPETQTVRVLAMWCCRIKPL